MFVLATVTASFGPRCSAPRNRDWRFSFTAATVINPPRGRREKCLIAGAHVATAGYTNTRNIRPSRNLGTRFSRRSRGSPTRARTRFHGRPKRSNRTATRGACERGPTEGRKRERSLEGGLFVDALNPVNRGQPGQKLNDLRSRARPKLVVGEKKSKTKKQKEQPSALARAFGVVGRTLVRRDRT